MKNTTTARFLLSLISGLTFSSAAFAERQVECYPDRPPQICVGDIVQNLYLGGDALVLSITSRGDFELRQIRGPYAGSKGRGYYLDYIRLLQRGQRAPQPQPRQPVPYTPAQPRPAPVEPAPIKPQPVKVVKPKPAAQPAAPAPKPQPQQPAKVQPKEPPKAAQPKPEVKPQPAKPKAKPETPAQPKPAVPKQPVASDSDPLPPLPDSGVIVDLPNVN